MGRKREIPILNILFTMLIPLLVLLAPSSILALTYNVSPDGNDGTGNGTLSNPWKTLGYACSRVAANQGNTIHLISGIYAEAGQSVVPPGVNVEGEGPDKTIIRSSYNGWLMVLQSDTVNNGNQTLSHFKIDGQNRQLDRGILIKGRHNVIVHHVDFEEIDNTGLEIVAQYGPDKNSPPSAYLNGIEVYKCNFVNCAKDFSGWSGGCLQIGHLDGALIHDLVIRENRGYGIKYWQGGWFKGVKIYNNTISVPASDPSWEADICIEMWNSYDDCEVNNNYCNTWLSFAYGAKGNGKRSVKVYDNRVVFLNHPNNVVGIECHSVSDMKIYNNYVEKASFGVAVWGDVPYSNVLIHHNVFYNMKSPQHGWGSGIEIHAEGITINNVQIFNNVFHNIDTSGSTTIGAKLYGDGRVSGFTMKNNVFFNSTKNIGEEILNDSSWKGSLSDCNISFNCYCNVLEGGGCLFSNNINQDPGLAMTGNKPDPFYRPASEKSPLVDTGTPVGLPFSGSAPDIGAFEYANDIDFTPPTPPTGLRFNNSGPSITS